jgi:phosphopantetheinyl transferase (holo-ACP synthase)
MAGTFAAKEAVYKALKNFSGSFSAIEIRRDKNGRPTVWIGGKEEKSFFVSISHTDKIAMAIALNQ